MSDQSPPEEGMSSSRPYMIRAIHAWINDNGMTPYIVVDATNQMATVPIAHINDGKIVLNSSYSAVSRLSIDNEWISFSARFAGASEQISFPPAAVRAIYAKENGQGMLFPDDEGESSSINETISESDPGSISKSGRPALKIVK